MTVAFVTGLVLLCTRRLWLPIFRLPTQWRSEVPLASEEAFANAAGTAATPKPKPKPSCDRLVAAAKKAHELLQTFEERVPGILCKCSLRNSEKAIARLNDKDMPCDHDDDDALEGFFGDNADLDEAVNATPPEQQKKAQGTADKLKADNERWCKEACANPCGIYTTKRELAICVYNNMGRAMNQATKNLRALRKQGQDGQKMKDADKYL